MNTTARKIPKKRSFPTRSKEMRESEDFIGLIKSAAIVSGIVIVCALASALLLTAAIFPTADPTRLAVPFSAALLCTTAIASGLISSKRAKNAPWAAGLLSGIILELFVLITALFLGHKGMILSPGTRVLLFLLIVPLSVLGTLFGNMKLTKKRRTTIRRR